MTIQDISFQQKLSLLRQGFKKLRGLAGEKVAKSVYRVQVRDLCTEFGLPFEEYWHE